MERRLALLPSALGSTLMPPLTKAGYERLRPASPTHLRGVACHFLDRIPDGELESMRRTLERVTEQA